MTTLLAILAIAGIILALYQRAQYVKLRRRYNAVYNIALEDRATIRRLKRHNKCGRGK